MSVFHQSDPFWDRMVSILPTTHMIGGFNLAKIIPNRESMEHLHTDCKIYVNHCEPLNHQISCHIVNHCQPSFINHHIFPNHGKINLKIQFFPWRRIASWHLGQGSLDRGEPSQKLAPRHGGTFPGSDWVIYRKTG